MDDVLRIARSCRHYAMCKIDFLGSLSPPLDVLHDDAVQLQSQYKDLKWHRRIFTQAQLIGREDKVPFNDINVRRALNLAVDKQSILKDYMKGDGELLGYPYPPLPDWKDYYTPLNQMPADVQELFTGYNPDGTINVCEASGSKSRVVCTRTTWSRFRGYIPLQYKAIDD